MQASKALSTDQALYHIGDTVVGLWRIVSGVLILRQYTSDGKAQIIDILGPGEYVDMKLQGIRNHEAVAVTPCRLNQFSYVDLDEEKQAEFLDLALERLGFLQGHAVALGREYAEARVRGAVEYLASKANHKETNDLKVIELPPEFVLGRQQMADFCGLTLETVSRIFSSWRKSGIFQELPNQGVRLRFSS